MTTTSVVTELADKWLPMPWEKFFSPQRAPDMWFGDELPPTLQAQVLNPFVQQSKLMLQHTVAQGVEQGMRRQAEHNEQRRLAAGASRIGKRAKTKRR